MEIVEVEREIIQDFLNREWKPMNESIFGRYDPAMWEVQRYTLAAREDRELMGAAVFKIEVAGHGEGQREVAGPDRERQFWQPSRHPEAIYTQRFWRQKLDYLHDNPCRKGLVLSPEHWRYSSAAYWMGSSAESEVILTPLEW